jgi:hypothetical protein
MSAYGYQVVYGNQLADDLHNLFPELIYNPTRFTNVQDVLQYMQTSMRNRFDLFTYGRSLAPIVSSQHVNVTTTPVRIPVSMPVTAASIPVATAATATNINPSTPPTRVPVTSPPSLNTTRMYRQTTSAINPVSLLSAFEFTDDDDINGFSESILTNVLTQFLRPSSLLNPTSNLEPVIVRPTQTQIDESTELITNSTNLTDACAICQDDFPSGSQIRKIKYCGHQFHKNCIDQWFQRNVKCPVCRHDIRQEINSSIHSSEDI